METRALENRVVERPFMASELPIEDLRVALQTAAAPPGGAIVVQAPTGSGKSTQVPQILLDGGLEGEIVVLQPRRIAARMLATRVAFERGSKVGEEIGYQVRFERLIGPKTRVRFLTEGVLLRQMLSDPDLKNVDAVVFDEFHERHLDADIGLARCRQLQQTTRPDLRLIVMSATLETEGLMDFLEPCELLESEGRTFPVDIQYRPQGGRDMPLWEKMTRAARGVASDEGIQGHFLMFLPGGFEIRKTVDSLQREKWARGMDILPLYGDLPPQQQDAAVNPSARPKIIVATNVAETSLTIDGVRVVIDSGLARLAKFDPIRGINTLTVESVSQASADQRAGRAGRTAPGICVRLWNEAHHRARPPQEAPEIHRLDLAETLLHLKKMGLTDLEAFPWFERPNPMAMANGMRLLESLGALSKETGGITDIGRRMADFPVSPRYGRLLVEAEQRDDAHAWVPACLLVSLAQSRPLFPKGKAGESARQRFIERGDESDLLPLIRGYQAASAAGFRVDRCRELGVHAGAAREVERLLRMLVRRGGYQDIPEQNLHCPMADLLLPAFPDQIAVRHGVGSKVFDVAGGRRGKLGNDSVIASQAKLVVAGELIEIEGKDLQVLLGMATAVTEEDLLRHFPNDLHEQAGARYETSNRRVVAESRRCFRDLVLDSRQMGEPPEEESAQLLAEQVAEGNLKLKLWNHAVESWLARVAVVREAMPELEIPEFSDEDRLLVLTEICRGGFTYKQIKDRHVLPVVKQWLSEPLQAAVKSYAPEEVTLTNGMNVKIDYVTDPEPTIKVILQRLYDVVETPTICDRRVTLKVQILAPNQRPAQVTRDLKGFWENSYAGVRSELKGRYPKHEWR